ncbi:r1t family holin [Microcella alkaliphila]|uniref:R1t family holin n=1 Tax=Microcella alkaliphila TaxID=279828 RepID=A0A4Q7TFP1_9MICO|nr:holin [Microcella alkaliphila]RZT59306.1 r1t family holin [Microcella alkaliphila]
MSKYASKRFWVDTFDRCLATTAQAAIGVLTAGVTGLLEVDWVQGASVAGLAGLVSVLTSVALRGGKETAE